MPSSLGGGQPFFFRRPIIVGHARHAHAIGTVRQPMRWLRALMIGGFTAIVAFIVAMIVGSIVMEARGMGDFEGERSIYVGLALAPFAMLGGLIVGAVFGARPGH